MPVRASIVNMEPSAAQTISEEVDGVTSDTPALETLSGLTGATAVVVLAPYIIIAII
jgi:hypothetical protein